MMQAIIMLSFTAAMALDDGTMLLQPTDVRPEQRMLYNNEDAAGDRVQVRSIKSFAVARKAQYESMKLDLDAASAQLKKVTELATKLKAERANTTSELDSLTANLDEVSHKLEVAQHETEEIKSSNEEKKDKLKHVPDALASVPRKTELAALRRAIDVREKEMSNMDVQLQKLRLETKGYETKAEEEIAAEQRLSNAQDNTKASVEEKDLADHQVELVSKETKRINELASIMREWKPKPDDKDQVGIAHRLLLSAGVENDAKDLQLEIVKILSERSEARKSMDTQAAHDRIQQLRGELELIQKQISDKDDMLVRINGNFDLEEEAPKPSHKKHRHPRSASLLQKEDEEELKSIACASVKACKKLLAGLDKQNEEMEALLGSTRRELSLSSQSLRRDLGVAEREGRGLDKLNKKIEVQKAALTATKQNLDYTSSALADLKKEFKVLETELAISNNWANRLAHSQAPADGGDFDMSFLENSARTLVGENAALKAKSEEVAAAKKELEQARLRSAEKVAVIKAQAEASERETARNVQTARASRMEALQKLKDLNRAVDEYDEARVAAGSAIRAEPTMNKGLMKLSQIGYFASQDDQDKVDMLTEAWRMENEAIKEYTEKKGHLLSLIQEFERSAAKDYAELEAAASEVTGATVAAQAKRQELEAKTLQVDQAQDSRVQALYDAF